MLITERDRLILELAAEHRLVLPAHAGALLGVSVSTAGARLRALSQAGYLSPHRLFAGQPTCYQVSRRGLDLLGSRLPKPRMDLRAYSHDVGVAWLWLAARGGTFGPLREVISERALRSRDGRRVTEPSSEPLGVRVGGLGPQGRQRLHYPDLVLVTREGRRIAVELELTAKGRRRREQILAAYGGDARFDAVLYLVDHPALARSIRSSARRLGISSHVHVQWAHQPSRAGLRPTAVAQRSPVHRAGRSPVEGRQP